MTADEKRATVVEPNRGTSAQTSPTNPEQVRRPGVRALARRHPVMTYFVLAYAISWSWWVPLALRGDVVHAGVGWPTHLPGLIGPAVAAVLVTSATEGWQGLRDLGRRTVRWRIGVRWWLVVAATFALIGLGAVRALVTGEDVPALADFTRYTGIGPIAPVAVIAVVLVLNGLGEEAGWRGFAVERLLPDHDLRWTALVVGAGWAGWHLPFFWLVDTFRSFGPLAAGWFISMLAASLVLAQMYVAGQRSILLVAAWHTAFNFTSATEATGAVVGTVMSVAVISRAVWILRHPGAVAAARTAATDPHPAGGLTAGSPARQEVR
jgi:membrane protease YdiL (CAAX protease family)